MFRMLLQSRVGFALKYSPSRCYTTASDPAVQIAQDSPIVPKFWKRKDVIDPSRFTIDCGKYDMSEIPSNNAELCSEMLTKFKEVGIVMLKNTNLGEDLGKMSEWAKVPMGKINKYAGGANQRKEMVENVYDTGTPSGAYLHYHHEMAYISQSVSMLAFCAKSALKPTQEDPYRGATFLSDTVKATDDILQTAFGRKLRDLGVCYISCLADREAGSHPGIYNYWQTSFLTENVSDVERLAYQNGLQFSWGPDRCLRTKFYCSAYEYFAQLDRNLLYGSLAHHGSWFDSWAGVAELPDMPSFESATPSYKPLKMVFGDNSKMEREDLELYADVYDRHGFPLAWEQGDVGIFCNHRFAHGRARIDENEGEKREIGVVLGPIFNRVGQLNGKW